MERSRKKIVIISHFRVSSSLSAVLSFVFLLVFLGRSNANDLKSNYTNYKYVSSLRLQRIQKHLDKINKPSLRTIKSPDGDIIDCVYRHLQPALDHPKLRNHKIQTGPALRPKFKEFDSMKSSTRNYNSSAKVKGSWQTWHKVGHCPKGTIPIRRTSVDDVLRAKSMFHHGKKSLRRATRTNGFFEPPDIVSGNGHEHAIAYTSRGEFYGARATMNVWDPSVEGTNEFSLSQMWVLSGSFDGSELNSIEAGWQVSLELYGDSRPRLFTYWTSDAYQSTGCYNHFCSGFVQTNSRIAIGASISPVSSFSGNQYDITILIWKDIKLGNWWMGFGDNTLVGYWPAELFTHLADHADMVEWGGEIVNTRSTGQHTSTQMGSGNFAGSGFKHASYFRNLEVVDSDNSLSSVGSLSTLSENPNCYDIKSDTSNDWGNYFYFGGPGHNSQCP